MNPIQTALGPYCLQYRPPKNISRCEEQAIKVVTGGLRDYMTRFYAHFKYLKCRLKLAANFVILLLS